MTGKTINQLLDLIFQRYNRREIQTRERLSKIVTQLRRMKIQYGGNTPIKNATEIMRLINMAR